MPQQKDQPKRKRDKAEKDQNEAAEKYRQLPFVNPHQKRKRDPAKEDPNEAAHKYRQLPHQDPEEEHDGGPITRPPPMFGEVKIICRIVMTFLFM